jgi:hypothetical protein
VLPQVDVRASGWEVQHGQAVWQPRIDRPDVAGELLVATRADGQCFIQFTKEPFPIVTAQANSTGWSVCFGPEGQRLGGKGRPPARWVWFQLPCLLEKQAVGGDWSVTRSGTNSFRLENTRTREVLAGYLSL